MAHITLHTPLHDAHVPQNPHLVQHGLGILSDDDIHRISGFRFKARV